MNNEKNNKVIRYIKLLALPIAEILLGSILIGIAVNNIGQHEAEARRGFSEVNAMAYSDRIIEDIKTGTHITDTLEQIIISEDGSCDKFDEIAANLMNDSIQSIQLAPAGVVTDIYPEKGNEAGKIDLFNDEVRSRYAAYAMEHDIPVMQGPFELKQGGRGIAVRNPVFLNKNGTREFWGFTVVIIRVPDIFSESLKVLESFGYDYMLLKTLAPWDDEYVEIYSSGVELIDPVKYHFTVDGDTWELQITQKEGWIGDKDGLGKIVLFGGNVILILLVALTFTALLLEDRRKHFKLLAETDKLTGIYNRSGFDKVLKKYLKNNPDKNCIVAELDIDDFKFINDIYGHEAGDEALRCLASYMKEYFPTDAVIGRNGGDEFVAFIPNHTGETAHNKLEEFTKLHMSFLNKNEQHSFTISLGYAEYPKQARTREELLRYADAALYEIKLRGKNGFTIYENGPDEIRTQLGFALKDVSVHLPGAFLIYKADPNDDELLFANNEMIKLAGCNDMEEFFAYTGRSFRKLIKESEQKDIEESIWRQINADDADSNDYVSFTLVRKDGSHIKVFDHGRIVDHSYYGRVFYVLIMKRELIDKHYYSKGK